MAIIDSLNQTLGQKTFKRKQKPWDTVAMVADVSFRLQSSTTGRGYARSVSEGLQSFQSSQPWLPAGHRWNGQQKPDGKACTRSVASRIRTRT